MPTRTRTDVHRPSAMVPADYAVLAIPFVYRADDPIEGREFTFVEFEEYDERWSEMGKPMEATWEAHVPGTCDHCGAALKYNAILLHLPTGDLVAVGRDCVARFWNLDWSNEEMLFQARMKRERIIAAFKEAHPEAGDAFDWALAEGRGAAKDIAEKMLKGWSLSPKQIALVVSIFERTKAPITVAAGRRTVEGVVTKVTSEIDAAKSSRWGGTAYRFKMTVLADDGVRYWGTVPASIFPYDLPYGQPALDAGQRMIGFRVRFDAKVEPKDATFATFERPTKAEYVGAEPWNGYGEKPEAEASRIPSGTAKSAARI